MRTLRPTTTCLTLALTACIVGTGTGCAYRTPEVHVPAALPTGIFAGDVDVDVHLDHHRADAATTADVTSWMGKMLPKKAGSQPAHVWVRVDADEMASMGNGWEACNVACLFPVLLGMNVGHQTVRVQVVIETGGRLFKGFGGADKWGSLWAMPLKRALAVALDRALTSAASSPPEMLPQTKI